MVKQVVNIVYREVKGLHQAAYVLALFAFGSQLLALFRDRMLAHQFGAGSDLDLYYVAFKIPDLLFVLFASSLSVYVLIPFVVKAIKKTDETDQEGSALLSQVFTLFLIIYSIVALVIGILAPYLLPKLFPGVVDMDTLVLMTRILLLQPFLLGVSSLFGVVTQLGHRFVLYALSPLLYNIGIIFGILFLYPIFGLVGLAFGVVLGAVGHLLVQWPFVSRSDLKIGISFNFNWKQITSIIITSAPRALTLSMQQIVILVLVSMASVMTAGSVSVFQFAYNLQSVPLSIIGVSYSVAAFPVLAEMFAKRQHEKFVEQILTALRHIIFWSFPAIALIIVIRAQLVRVVLGSGAFDWADTRLTAAVLAVLAFSLLAQAIILVVTRAFYAGGHTRVPFYVTLFGSILAVSVAYLFATGYVANVGIQNLVASFMRLEGVAGSEVLAIAFGYSLAIIGQAIILTLMMGRLLQVPLGWIYKSLVHSFCAATIGGLSAYVTLNFVVVGIDQERFIGMFIQGLIAGTFGIVGTVLTYAYFKSPELKEIYLSFHRRIWKTDIVASQD